MHLRDALVSGGKNWSGSYLAFAWFCCAAIPGTTSRRLQHSPKIQQTRWTVLIRPRGTARTFLGQQLAEFTNEPLPNHLKTGKLAKLFQPSPRLVSSLFLLASPVLRRWRVLKRAKSCNPVEIDVCGVHPTLRTGTGVQRMLPRCRVPARMKLGDMNCSRVSGLNIETNHSQPGNQIPPLLPALRASSYLNSENENKMSVLKTSYDDDGAVSCSTPPRWDMGP